MSVGLGTQIALSAALGLGLLFSGCGNSAPVDEGTPESSPSVPTLGNYPSAGAGASSSTPSSGFKGWRSDAGSSGSTAAAGSSGATAAAGSAGHAAGSGGSAGSHAAAGAGGAAGMTAAAGSGGGMEDDPLGDLFGLGSGTPSCEGLICVEDKDCQDLYPTENATCKFTKCVDLTCK